MSKKVRPIIAQAIQKADSSYFFENYEKQADAVIKTLVEKGFVITPIEPTDTMLEAGKEAIFYGRNNPIALAKVIFIHMLKACAKESTSRSSLD